MQPPPKAMDNAKNLLEFDTDDRVPQSTENQPDGAPSTTIDSRGDLHLVVGSSSERSKEARRFIVCSRALSRVSPYFDRMLYGPFAEAKHDKEHWIVNLEEDSPAPFEVFATIAHGYLTRIPRTVTVDQLYDLTTLTHYYDATGILAPWAQSWVASLHQPFSEINHFKMLWVAWELGQGNLFESIARRILMDAPASAFSSDSPIATLRMPPGIIERINAIRIETVDALLDIFRQLIGLLAPEDGKQRVCIHGGYMGPYKCESMILGSISFCLLRANLWPLPETADVSMSISDLHRILLDLVIHDIGRHMKGGEDHSECNPKEILLSKIQRVLVNMPDIVLEPLKRQILAQHKKISGY
ncbi:hypothetical protein GQ53DRAFT_886072 [Thozetella sp. PMI_491]|nr:hypothetical protein GQ53DRAFT_886072 [Thozetella sp. PMI_491]